MLKDYYIMFCTFYHNKKKWDKKKFYLEFQKPVNENKSNTSTKKYYKIECKKNVPIIWIKNLVI